MNSFEVDYFTEVIIDELKKEIRELKNSARINQPGIEDQFKRKEENLLSKLSNIKHESEKLRQESSLERKEDSDLEKLKIEVENLKSILDKEREKNSTFESYIHLLKTSYTTMFGSLET